MKYRLITAFFLFITNIVIGQNHNYPHDTGITYNIISTEYFDKEHNWFVKVTDGGYKSISVLPDEKNHYALIFLESKYLKGVFKTVKINSIGYESIINRDNLYSRKDENQKGVNLFINEKNKYIRVWLYSELGEKTTYDLKYNTKEKFKI